MVGNGFDGGVLGWIWTDANQRSRLRHRPAGRNEGGENVHLAPRRLLRKRTAH